MTTPWAKARKNLEFASQIQVFPGICPRGGQNMQTCSNFLSPWIGDVLHFRKLCAIVRLCHTHVKPPPSPFSLQTRNIFCPLQVPPRDFLYSKFKMRNNMFLKEMSSFTLIFFCRFCPFVIFHKFIYHFKPSFLLSTLLYDCSNK